LTDYGRDILVDAYGDLTHASGAGDVVLVSGLECVAQDIALRALRLMLGWLHDDWDDRQLRAHEKMLVHEIASHPHIDAGSVYVVLRVVGETIEAALLAKTRSDEQLSTTVSA
jgi:hypothetical protein